jgi:hypothetical protein
MTIAQPPCLVAFEIDEKLGVALARREFARAAGLP